MDGFVLLLGKLFEIDAITTVCILVLIAVVLMGAYLYRKHTKTDKSPDFLIHDGYYRIALTPTGYKITDRNNLFRTLGSFYYLRSEPFSIEVSVDGIEADNGKKYRALAAVTAVMPEDRIDFVCRRYFSGDNKYASDSQIMANIMNRKTDTDSAPDIFAGYRQNQKTSSDEMLKQILNSNTRTSNDKRHIMEKTNCDADIDMELTIAFSSTLKKLVKEQAGALTEEEMKKRFLGQAMLCAMETGHAVTEVVTFNIIEITD